MSQPTLHQPLFMPQFSLIHRGLSVHSLDFYSHIYQDRDRQLSLEATNVQLWLKAQGYATHMTIQARDQA